MIEKLDILVQTISNEYNRLYAEWKNNTAYIYINQKSTEVRDILKNPKIIEAIENYRQFIESKQIELDVALGTLRLKELSSRVKTRNSVEYKRENYMSEKHEFGRVPINKCFNDLYGVRIILPKKLDYIEIKQFVDGKYNVRCIDATKDDYVATHIYFRKGNDCFRWELQIWDDIHADSNIESHEKYKQEYVKWEKEKNKEQQMNERSDIYD